MYPFLDTLTCHKSGSISLLSTRWWSCHYSSSCMCEFAACYNVITSADVDIVGIKYIGFNWHFYNVFKKSCGSALKRKVVVYAENRADSSGACLTWTMPTFAAGEMIPILYSLAKKQQNAFQDLRKEDTHKLMKLCCILSVGHLQNSCLSSSHQAIADEGRRNCQKSSNEIYHNSKQGETGVATSWRGLPLRHQTFYPKLPAGIRRKAVVGTPSGNAKLPVLLTFLGKYADPYD